MKKRRVEIDYRQPSISGQQKKSTTESWFCAICQEDRFADMRMLFHCRECVELTADQELFICPLCQDEMFMQ
jgi:hypothetical protein